MGTLVPDNNLGLEMNNQKAILKLWIGLGLLSLTSCASASSQGSEFAFSQENWPQRCQQVKKELSQQPAAKITYAPLPKDIAIQSSWKLNWLERQIPVPAMQYTDVFVLQDQDHHTILFIGQIEGENAQVMLGKSPKIEPLVDIFADIADADKTENSPEGTALTQKLFGGPVSMEKLTDLGYRHTLADLTCNQANWQKEVPIALALIFKGIATSIGPNTSAYDLNQGVLLGSKSESQDKWWFQWNGEQQYMYVMLTLPNGHQHGDLGFALGQKDWPVAPNAPVWLGQLETAISNPTRQNWQTLQLALKKAKMSEKSIEKIEALIESSPEG
ncbi:hypothetical protein [Acaryochloris marina]|uniref:Lipoprotein n=1 Tax=Acaryochloris marina (strain MBIC 11017) TaxID=329726 RepID=B0C8R5_ACAM1|nr:hypothetical protein [Acaryochloris marina]ABW31327.1 hypothetical protein AM1_6397 [Acaryochloris marina MBIC11017]BDM80001.1 hypothetical protein AM10699_28690 [Acaryochloris marina MBIC10699]